MGLGNRCLSESEGAWEDLTFILCFALGKDKETAVDGLQLMVRRQGVS